jgi:hypothetical protein
MQLGLRLSTHKHQVHEGDGKDHTGNGNMSKEGMKLYEGPGPYILGLFMASSSKHLYDCA